MMRKLLALTTILGASALGVAALPGEPIASAQEAPPPNDPYADQAAPGTDMQVPPPAADDDDGDVQAPAPPEPEGGVSEDTFDQTLSPYGQWADNADYGRVWHPDPNVVGADFSPYSTGGHWVYTAYGWQWVSDWNWGWAPFHYGRWFMDASGWGWVPGYSWGPAWVDWRYGGGYVGWAALPPHGWHGQYGVWRFTEPRYFASGQFSGHFVSPHRAYGVTASVGRSGRWGNTRWNAGPSAGRIGAAIGHPITPARIAPPRVAPTRVNPNGARPATPGHAAPVHGGTFHTSVAPATRAPGAPSWHSTPAPAVHTPAAPASHAPAAPAYRAPPQTYHAPAAPAYRAPPQTVHAPATHSAPAAHTSAPSRPSSSNRSEPRR